MTKDDIKKVLKAHKKWLDISGEKVAKAALDRLDATWKRENGHAEAMRVALGRIVSRTNSLDENCGVDPVEIRDIAREALNGSESDVQGS